jgi:hypothetical protein
MPSGMVAIHNAEAGLDGPSFGYACLREAVLPFQTR